MGYPYATVARLYDFLKAEAIVGSARAVTGLDPSTDRFRSPGHGLNQGDVLRWELGGDRLGGTPALPSPLSEYVVYYALPASGDLFAVSLTEGGNALDVTTAGTGLLSFVVDIEASLLRHINRNASRINRCLAARGVVLPLVGDYLDLESLVLRLTAWPVLLARGYTSGRTVDPDQDYKVLWTNAEEELDDLCDETVPLPPGLPVGAVTGRLATSWDMNAREWTPEGGGI